MPLPQQDETSTSTVVPDRDLEHHLAALGLQSVEEYVEWCAQHGFGTRPDKHWHQRCRERYFAHQRTIQSRCVRQKREKRHPRAALIAIANDELISSDLTCPHLILIAEAFASLEGHARNAFLRILLHVQECADLLSTMPVVRQFGTQAGNTFIDALSVLAKHHSFWLRPVEDWRPRSHNARRQFSSLVRYLLARYPVPIFMDCVWFKRWTAEAQRQQRWFQEIGDGKSPRQLDLPITFTKRMVHHFLRAPSDYTVEAVLRWAQVLGLGGNVRLVEGILGSRLATDFDHEEFWGSVIRWFIANPMLDTAQAGPIVDYIHHQKFQSQEIAVDLGQTENRPLQPDFSIQGRTPASILRQMREWYGELRKKPRQQIQVTWYESGIDEFEWIEGSTTLACQRRWTIKEILNRKDLFAEGFAMRHCVASYEQSCASGRSSIWSLGIERNDGRRKRVLTVEVGVDRKVVCQARGKANRLPSAKEMAILHRWAAQEGLTVDDAVMSR